MDQNQPSTPAPPSATILPNFSGSAPKAPKEPRQRRAARGSRGRTPIVVAIVVGLLAAGGVYTLVSRGGGDTVGVDDVKTGKTVTKPVQKRPLTLADVRGILVAPAGYKPRKPDPSDDPNETLCSKAKVSTKVTPANSVLVSTSVGETGPYSAQQIVVLPDPAAAQIFANQLTAGVPCSQKDKDGVTTTFTKRAIAGSYNFAGVSILPAFGVFDVIVERNVVYTSADIALGAAAETATHDARTRAVIAALKSR